MTSSMLFGDRRSTSSRRGGMTVLGKVPKPINLPSQRLENHGVDPTVEIVPKGTLGWGSRSSPATNAWGSSSLSPNADGGTSPSNLSVHLSSGSRPSTAGSEKVHESSASAWGPNSGPSSASGILTSNQTTTLTSLRPRSAETRPGSSQLSRFSEHSEHPVAWSAPGTAEKLGMMSSKNDGFSLTSGDFPTLGSEKDNHGANAETQDHSSYCRPGSSSGGRMAKEMTGDVSANLNVNSGTADSWKREHPFYSEDGGRPGMDKWQGNPQHYPSANVPPPHYDGWHAGPVPNQQGGGWYRGPPGATPYGAHVPPGGFPMEPFPYYPPQMPPTALANRQPVPPPGAGPRGHHPKNGDVYRPHMQDAYIRPGMPIRPGFYPGPVPFEGYYNSPMGYCNPNERDAPFGGMAAGPPVYNRYPNQSAHDPGNSHGRPGGYGPPNQMMSEQLESNHLHDTRGPYKVLLKQHDGWDRRIEEQRNESAVATNALCLEKDDHPRAFELENDWRSDHRKEGERDQRKAVGEVSSKNFDNEGASSFAKKVKSPESLGNMKAADVISVKKSGVEASGPPEVQQPLLAAPKNSSLILKIEGLNAKARVSVGQKDTTFVSSKEERKNNKSLNGPGSGFVNPERSHATEMINPSHEVSLSAGDQNQELTDGSGILSSRRTNNGMHGKSDPRGRGRLNNQEGEGRWKKSSVSEPTLVSTARLEVDSNFLLHEHLTPMEATEKSDSYPQGRSEEESKTPMLDPIDSEAQRAKMKELAKQRTKQLQEEEEERTRRQMAKALAKLEELNRRTQVAEGSNEKVESHLSDAIQNKQEELQTSGEPLIGRKSAWGSNLIAAAQTDKSSTWKVENSTVPSSELPLETAKSAGREPVLMNDQSVPLQREVIVANVVHHNSASQVQDSSVSKQKLSPKQKQSNQVEKMSTGKSTSTSTAEATKCQTDAVTNVPTSLGVVSNETASGSELNVTTNPSVMPESSSHPRKKNNRNGKNKHKPDNSSLVAPLSSSISKEPNLESTTSESGRPKVREVEWNPSSVQSQTIPIDGNQSLEQHSSLSHDESQGRVNSQWKPQHSRRVSRNSQAIKHSEKFQSSDTVVWAPVRSQNKADATDEAIPKNDADVSAVKTDQKVQSTSKNKRAEIERYVPKPVAKEMAYQGSNQQPVASVINQAAVNETVERADSVSQGAESSQRTTIVVGKVGIAIESRNGSSKQNKNGKAHGAWRQQGSTESTSMPDLQDGHSYTSNVGQSDKRSVQVHQSQKPDVARVIEQSKSSDEWNFSDGWTIHNEPVTVGPVSIPFVKDQGITGKGKQHPFKGHKAMGYNYDLDQKKNSGGDAEKINNQSSASEMGQTDFPAASKENRTVGERTMPRWKPKSQAFSTSNQWRNRASGGQNVDVEDGRNIKRETSPRGRVSRPPAPDMDTTEYGTHHRHDQLISERGNAGEGLNKREKKTASMRGRPRSPNQAPVSPVESGPANLDARQEQHFQTGFRKNGNQNGRFGRGQESRGDWSYSGHDIRQDNPPANRERQRPSSHLEYQPVGPYNNSTQYDTSERPRDGSQNRGGRVKERGQSHPRRGGGNFHGRQSSAVRVDADME